MKTDFSVRKSIPLLLFVIAVVIQIVSLALYCTTGKTEFTPELSPLVIAFGSAVIALGVCAVLLKLIAWGKKWVEVVLCLANLFGLLAFLFYMTSEVNYLANIFVSIDGTAISVTFVATSLLYLIAWVMSLLAAVACKYKTKGESL